MKMLKGSKMYMAFILSLSMLATNVTAVFADNNTAEEFDIEENAEILAEENHEYVPGEVIICLNGNYSIDYLNSLFNSKIGRSVNNSNAVAEIKDLTKAQRPTMLRSAAEEEEKKKIYLLKLGDEEQDIYDVVEAFEAYPEIEYASPNYLFEAEPPIANDYFYEDEEADAVLNMWGLEYVKGPQAWEYCTGSPDVTIGIVDSGVDFNHPDLADNMWINMGEWGENGELSNNGIDDDGNGYVDDYNGWNFYYDNNETYDVDGHGTHVAGTAAASGGNNMGVYGVAKDCKIASLRITSNPEDGEYGYAKYSFAAVIEALDYANAMNIPVTNNSYSQSRNFPPNYDEEFSAIFEAAIDNYNGIFVASSGNDGEGYHANYPGAYDCDNIICVSGSSRLGQPESDAFNFGASTVDLTAPGVHIWSCKMNTNEYVSESGTSMAVPHVVGAVALLKSFKPEMTNDEIKDCILSTVTKTEDYERWHCVAADGVLNVEAALAKAEELYPSQPDSMGKLKTWNFSRPNFNYLGSISAETTVNGLTLKPDANNMEIKKGNTTINNRDEYTHYLSLGGTVEFDVDGDTDIYITARSSSGEKPLTVIAGDDTVLSGGSLTYTTEANVQAVKYEGGAQKIKITGDDIRLINVTLRSDADSELSYEDSIWNFSKDNFANVGKVSAKINVDGLTLYPDVEIVDRNETLDGNNFTRYLDLKGKGSKEQREVSFPVNGKTKITISARSVSEARVLQVIDSFGCIIGEMNVDTALNTATFEYAGNPADLYISSQKGGIRIYTIETEKVY